MDYNHMAMDRVSGQQGLLWVGQNYHAMHHVYPNNFFSSFANVFDLIFGTTCQIEGRTFPRHRRQRRLWLRLVKAPSREARRHRRDAQIGVDFAPATMPACRQAGVAPMCWSWRMAPRTMDCWNANFATFVDLTELFTADRQGPADRRRRSGRWARRPNSMATWAWKNLRDYAASKRAFAARARGYYHRPALIYRHIVPSSFTSAMGKGLMSAEHRGGDRAVLHPPRLPLRAGHADHAGLLELLPFRSLKPGLPVAPSSGR